MKVQTKISVLLLAVAAAFFLSFEFFERSEHTSLKEVFRLNEAEAAISFQRLLAAQSEQLKAVTFDDSFWDEMLRFAQTGDRDWAKININGTMPVFKASAAWVYKKDFSLTYFWTSLKNLPADIIPPAALKQTLIKKPFSHFYARHGAQLIEIFTAPIQPSFDVARKTPPQGYFVTAANLATDRIAYMLPNTQLKLIDSRETCSPSSIDNGIISVSVDFNGIDGDTAARLCAYQKSDVYRKSRAKQKTETLRYTVFCAIVLLFLYFLLTIWVAKPLEIISDSLNSGNTAGLESARFRNAEFARVADMITAFFRQRNELRAEVDERRKMERMLEQFAKKIITVREEEKARLARYLRDDLGSHETALNSLLSLAAAELNNNNSVKALDHLLTAQAMLKELLLLTKNASDDLLPFSLGATAFEDAVKELIAKLQKKSSADITLGNNLPRGIRIPERVNIILLRIAQEALQNALRHGRPTRIDIELAHTNGKLRFVVHDNGKGFEPETAAQTASALGLQTMREYARAVDAAVLIISQIDKGTTVEVQCPIPEPGAERTQP